jgi:serine-type D-Ala-D-Ala carboxypeptidase
MVDRRQVIQGLGAMILAGACTSHTSGPSTGAPSKESHSATPTGPLTTATPESVGMSSRRVEDVLARIDRRVKDGLFPGAVALVARYGRIVGHRAFGKMVAGGDEPVTLDTLFDLESMTKVIATAIAALVLVERGKMQLDDPVIKYLPTFTGAGKDKVTVRDMLRYSAGLPLDNQFLEVKNRAEALRRMAETPLVYAPGTRTEYSDLTYRLLGCAIESAAGTNLDAFARAHVWKPIGMIDTLFTPPQALLPRVAATGHSALRGRLVRGEVQDEQDYALGGICGCDGVFSTARDVAVFGQMILDGGAYGGVRLISRELATAMVHNQTPWVSEAQTDISPIDALLYSPKGYGWECYTPRFSSGGMRLSSGASYGKAGGAGTFLWIDARRGLVAVLLTNHGLPVPFDDRNWDRLLYDVGSGEFYDGVVNAVTREG